jgi:hypothetical protein
MTKEIVSAKSKNNNDYFALSQQGFKNTNYSNFYGTKTSKFQSERERTTSTFFNMTKPKGFQNKAGPFSGRQNANLPDIRRKFDMKIKETLNLSKGEPKTYTNKFFHGHNTGTRLKENTFSNLKPRIKNNDSVPINILESIYTSTSTNKIDYKMPSISTNNAKEYYIVIL